MTSHTKAILSHLRKSTAGGERSVAIPMRTSEGAGLHCSVGARTLVWERVMDELLPLMQ